LEDDRDPEEEDHGRIEPTPSIPKVRILVLVNPPDVHLGNHLRRKEERDEEIREEGRILEWTVSVKRPRSI